MRRCVVGVIDHRIGEHLQDDLRTAAIAGHQCDDRRQVAAGAVADDRQRPGSTTDLAGVLGHPRRRRLAVLGSRRPSVLGCAPVIDRHHHATPTRCRSARQTPSWLSRSQSTKPPPWKNIVTGGVASSATPAGRYDAHRDRPARSGHGAVQHRGHRLRWRCRDLARDRLDPPPHLGARHRRVERREVRVHRGDERRRAGVERHAVRPTRTSALSWRILRRSSSGRSATSSPKSRGLGEPLAVGIVRAHHDRVAAAEVGHDLHHVVFGIGAHAHVLVEDRAGRAVSLPPFHGPRRPMPRLLSMWRTNMGHPLGAELGHDRMDVREAAEEVVEDQRRQRLLDRPLAPAVLPLPRRHLEEHRLGIKPPRRGDVLVVPVLTDVVRHGRPGLVEPGPEGVVVRIGRRPAIRPDRR